MSDNTAIFLILTVAIIAAVVLVGIGTWQRAKRNDAARVADGSENASEMKRLRGENDGLKAQVEHLEDRMAVLERIATDPAVRTAREIETLR